MAASYTVLPITNEVAEWLKEKGIAYSPSSINSRFPTPKEIRKVLDGLADCKIEYVVQERTWQAVITDAADRWTDLVVLDFRVEEGAEQVSHKFYFERGWPELMKRILKELSMVCGPMALISNADPEPVLISPDNDSPKAS